MSNFLFNKNLKLLITFGSQTGNAEEISKIMDKKLSKICFDRFEDDFGRV